MNRFEHEDDIIKATVPLTFRPEGATVVTGLLKVAVLNGDSSTDIPFPPGWSEGMAGDEAAEYVVRRIHEVTKAKEAA